jgi:hypothetical protein
MDTTAKNRLVDMEKLCEVQAKLIEKQKKVIEKLQFDHDVSQGEVAYFSCVYYGLAYIHADIIHRRMLATKLSEKGTPEDKKIYLEMGERLEPLLKLRESAFDAWAKFTEMYPAHAKVILDRISAEASQGVQNHG